MAGFKRGVFVGRPVQEVFDFATDLANVCPLIPRVTKVELLTDSGMRSGAS
jgi:hypothetical protein